MFHSKNKRNFGIQKCSGFALFFIEKKGERKTNKKLPTKIKYDILQQK